jgi:hypothetical protein
VAPLALARRIVRAQSLAAGGADDDPAPKGVSNGPERCGSRPPVNDLTELLAAADD